MKKLAGLLAAALLCLQFGFAQNSIKIESIDKTDAVTFNKKVDGFKNVTVINGKKITKPNLATVSLAKYADNEVEIRFSCDLKVVNSTGNDTEIIWMINEQSAGFPELNRTVVKNGEWTKFKGSKFLTLSENKSLYISGAGHKKDTLTIYIKDFKVELFGEELGAPKSVQPSWLETPSLNKAYAEYFDYIGFATPKNVLENTEIEDGIARHAGAVTMENEFKPDFVFAWQRPSNFENFTGEDGNTYKVPTNTPVTKNMGHLMQYAQLCGVKMRGHVLVWHNQTPDWFFKENFDSKGAYVSPSEMNARLEWYIKTVLEYIKWWEDKYNKGERMVITWDVVNEAISDGESKSQILRTQSNWYNIYKDETFIVNAFRYANKYAPSDVLLAYNDYGCSSVAKNAAICQLIDKIQAAPDARIDVLGMQTHVGMNTPITGPNSFETAIQNFLAKGIDVQITEMDIGMDGQRYNSERLKTKYKDFMTMFLNNRKVEGKNGVRGVTFWGIVDERSWIYNNADSGNAHQRPLLFDGNYTCKPAFYGVLEAATEYESK